MGWLTDPTTILWISGTAIAMNAIGLVATMVREAGRG